MMERIKRKVNELSITLLLSSLLIPIFIIGVTLITLAVPVFIYREVNNNNLDKG